MDLNEILRQLIEDGGVRVTIEITLLEDENAKTYAARCERCGWHRNTYRKPESARRGLRAHRQHCTGNAPAALSDADLVRWIAEQNGGKGE